MASRLSKDHYGRISFAVIAVVILIGATASVAYLQTVEQDIDSSPEIPIDEFESIISSIETELDGVASASLRSTIRVFKETMEGDEIFPGLPDLLRTYGENATAEFESRLHERYNGTFKVRNVEVEVSIVQSEDRDDPVVPIYGDLTSVTEIGETRRRVPFGFELEREVEIDMFDPGSEVWMEHTSTIIGSINTDSPAVIDVLYALDLERMDSLISSMASAVAFARAFGQHHMALSVDLGPLPGPDEELDRPGYSTDGEFFLGFDSDMGPLGKDQILSWMDRAIIRDLAFIITQVRAFGIWDQDFADDLVDMIQRHSLTPEGKEFRSEDLRKMIGEGYPNYVNVEELVLELFLLMGQVPSTVNIAGPQLRKMLEQGFMALLGDGWKELVDRWILDSSPLVTGIVDKKGNLDPGWLLENTFLLTGYSGLLLQFLSLELYYILKAYHFDRPEEIEEAAGYIIDSIIEDVLLKDIPDKISVPSEEHSWFEVDVKEEVRKAAHSAIDLTKLVEVPLFGMEFNGYSLVYLFFTFYEDVQVDSSEAILNYEEVFDEWKDSIRGFIKEQNLTACNETIDDLFDSFSSNRTKVSSGLSDLEKVDLSGNQTLNSSLNEAIWVLGSIKQNLTAASKEMGPAVAFYDFGTEKETAAWRRLNDTMAKVNTLANELDSCYWDLFDLWKALNSSSPEYNETKKAKERLYSTLRSVERTEPDMYWQLDKKWKRDALVESLDLVDRASTTGSDAGALYQVVGLLSEELEPHGGFGFNRSLDDLVKDLGQASADSRGFKLRDDKKISIKSIINDDRGIIGIIELMKHNLDRLSGEFLEEMYDWTTVELVEEEGWKDGAGYPDLNSSNERLLYRSFLLSNLSVSLKKEVVEEEISLYEPIPPIDILMEKAEFGQYEMRSYLMLQEHVLEALQVKLEAMEEIFNNTEMFPGLSMTFDHLKKDSEWEKDVDLLKAVSFEYTGSKDLEVSGQRMFDNISDTAMEDILMQYLSPFSDEWYDYYLTAFVMDFDGLLDIGLRFDDKDEAMHTITEREACADLELNYSAASMVPSPLPIVDIRYRPVSNLLQRPRDANLDRNVFTNTVRSANLNFTYSGYDEFNITDSEFRVQVTAKVESLVTSALAPIMLGGIDFDDWSNVRDLTNRIRVVDNGEKDQDPRIGHVSVRVELKIDRLKTTFFGKTVKENSPILFIKVWRPTTFNALLSATAIRAVGSEGKMFQTVPSLEVVEQGFVYFEDEDEPVIPVFDVGKGDREIDIPWHIYLDDLVGNFLPPMKFGLIIPNRYYKDDPAMTSIFDLTCEFDLITDIPPDSMVLFKRGMPFLVDFDGGGVVGNRWIRDWHLNYISIMKDVPTILEDQIFGILPSTLVDEFLDRSAPPSEYKFVRIFDFVPIYLQYFQGYQGPPDYDKLLEGEDVMVTWDENPDLYHLPYRAVPINTYRGAFAASLWYDLLDDLRRQRYVLELFVPDIIQCIENEINDIIGMYGGVAKGSSSKDATATAKELSLFKDGLKFRKAMDDQSKLMFDVDRPEMVLSTPGAKRGFDLGANFYLGFDVAKVNTKYKTKKWNNELMTQVGLVGFYSDVKTMVKFALDIANIASMTKVKDGKKDSAEEKKSSKGLDAKDPKTAYKALKTSFKEYKKLLKTMKEYKKWIEGSGARSEGDYVPSLFRIQAELGLSNDTIKEDGDLAWETGYSLIDVAILRHRNGFSEKDIEDLKEVDGRSKDDVHGLTCIDGLGPAEVEAFVDRNDGLGVSMSEYCDLGSTNMTVWEDIRHLLDSGVEKKVVKDAAQIGLPLTFLRRFDSITIIIPEMVEKAKAITDIQGHKVLFSQMNADPANLAVLEAAFDNKDGSGTIIRPFGEKGSDIYMYDRLIFAAGSWNDLKNRKEMDSFFEKGLQDVCNKLYKDSELYFYFDLVPADDLGTMTDSLSDVAVDIDEEQDLKYYTILTRTQRMDLMRTPLEVVPIRT